MLAKLTLAAGDVRLAVGDDMARCRTAGLLILKNCEIARARRHQRASATGEQPREMKEAMA